MMLCYFYRIEFGLYCGQSMVGDSNFGIAIGQHWSSYWMAHETIREKLKKMDESGALSQRM